MNSLIFFNKKTTTTSTCDSLAGCCGIFKAAIHYRSRPTQTLVVVVVLRPSVVPINSIVKKKCFIADLA